MRPQTEKDLIVKKMFPGMKKIGFDRMLSCPMGYLKG